MRTPPKTSEAVDSMWRRFRSLLGATDQLIRQSAVTVAAGITVTSVATFDPIKAAAAAATAAMVASVGVTSPPTSSLSTKK
jgi:hypothetical protein